MRAARSGGNRKTPVEIAGNQRELYEAIRVAAHAKVRQTIRKKGLAGSTVPILDALAAMREGGTLQAPETGSAGRDAAQCGAAQTPERKLKSL